MKIHNVRLGMACNSSSTHSLILLRDPSVAHNDEDTDFGWSYFTAIAPEAKQQYLAHILYQNLCGTAGRKGATHIVRSLFGDEVQYSKTQGVFDSGLEGHVDHQSVWGLPVAYERYAEKELDYAFFADLRKYIMRSNLAILGGNDNDDVAHPLVGSGERINLGLPLDIGGLASGLISRKDHETGVWVLFNSHTGAKTRISFSDNANPYVKSSAPELVDLKITDHCPYGCAFCYMGSTQEGKHADYGYLESVVRSLGELQVLEVAIGGGEPTLYPDFLKLLREIRWAGPVPNFTTKNLAWLRDAKFAKEVFEYIGSFAYSVERPEDIENLTKLFKELGHPTEKATIQYVMGSQPPENFKALLKAAGKSSFRLTLLGYKTTGRGAEFQPHPYGDWVKAVREAGLWRVGIDTALVQHREDDLIKEEIPSYMYTGQEGKFSCYIDGVIQQIGPSSYCGPEEMVSLSPQKDRWTMRVSPEQIKAAFAKF